MQVRVAPSLQDTREGREAARVLGQCVHCGICLANCPTYRVLGDELDGPRGRIYLIKQVVEGVTPTQKTQQHLDRCLTCRACETTCPSGVEYGRLLDVGRSLVDEQVGRAPGSRAVRMLLRAVLTRPRLFAALVRLGQLCRPLLPFPLRNRIPARRAPRAWPRARHPQRALLLAGCVQPALAPGINASTARVLDVIGIETIVAENAGCCGAIRQHLGDPSGALDDARRNIDAWWPHVRGGASTLLMNASGCGLQVREYGNLLRHDAAYAEKAEQISRMTSDLVEVVAIRADALRYRRESGVKARIAFHPPCTLQHGQKIRGAIEALLENLGATVVPVADGQLCCGSAGTYSVLQPDLSGRLRDERLSALLAPAPELILSANIGCIAHLAGGTDVPVRHWIEWVDENIDAGTEARA